MTAGSCPTSLAVVDEPDDLLKHETPVACPVMGSWAWWVIRRNQAVGGGLANGMLEVCAGSAVMGTDPARFGSRWRASPWDDMV